MIFFCLVPPRLYPVGVRILYSSLLGYGSDPVVIILPTPSSYPHGISNALGYVDHPTYFSDLHALLSARGQYHAHDAR